MILQELKNKLSEIEWEDFEVKEAYNLRDVPRLVEGNFTKFLNTLG